MCKGSCSFQNPHVVQVGKEEAGVEEGAEEYRDSEDPDISAAEDADADGYAPLNKSLDISRISAKEWWLIV